MRYHPLLAFLAALPLVSCQKKVGPDIDGKWIMPGKGFMSYELALSKSGDYTRWFSSDSVGDEIPENPKKGKYSFSGGVLTIPVINHYPDGHIFAYKDTFTRETINGVEVLLRDDTETIWHRCGMIYTGGLLIKTSDDPMDSTAQGESESKKLFTNGIEEWSQEREDAKARHP